MADLWLCAALVLHVEAGALVPRPVTLDLPAIADTEQVCAGLGQQLGLVGVKVRPTQAAPWRIICLELFCFFWSANAPILPTKPTPSLSHNRLLDLGLV